MTSKCANPACNAPFRYFRSGRIYLIGPHLTGPEPDDSRESTNGPRVPEYFWLCGECARDMRLVVNDHGAIVIEPVPFGLVPGVPFTTRKLRAKAS